MLRPVLTYFSSRGRAELIRLLLADAGVDYAQRAVGVYHPVDKTPEFSELRASGLLPFDALPLWQEPDGFRLAQSDAIVRHLARTHGLYGDGPHAAARCDELAGGIDDLRAELRKLWTVDPARRAALRDELVAHTIPRWLGYFERMIGGELAAGSSLSWADLNLSLLCEAISDNGFGAALAAAPRLVELVARVDARPGLAAYRASPSRFPAQLLPT